MIMKTDACDVMRMLMVVLVGCYFVAKNVAGFCTFEVVLLFVNLFWLSLLLLLLLLFSSPTFGQQDVLRCTYVCLCVCSVSWPSVVVYWRFKKYF